MMEMGLEPTSPDHPGAFLNASPSIDGEGSNPDLHHAQMRLARPSSVDAPQCGLVHPT